MIYCVADQSNSSVEKAGLLGSMAMRLLPTDDKCRLRGATLEQAIKSDREKGLIPCYVSTVISTFRLQNANHPTYHLGEINKINTAYTGNTETCKTWYRNRNITKIISPQRSKSHYSNAENQ
jgi:hypothetical protein